jgi:hypothetical protein
MRRMKSPITIDRRTPITSNALSTSPGAVQSTQYKPAR